MLGIKNWFPLKAKTLDELVNLVRKEGCSSIMVEPELSAKNGRETASVGMIANFQYTLKFVSETPGGRKIVYRETNFQRFGSGRGFADAEDRGKAAIKHFLIGEERVKYLRSRLPGVALDLIGPGNRPMDDSLYDKLHKDAASAGLL